MIESKNGTLAKINFPDKQIHDDSGIIERCLNALGRKENGNAC